ncbi:hypothetical protein COO91_02544 [Nostoc flagelliforme CCNUN1]|uniref:Uncharacterized protein n=1 Tax=Nostoc flagelliforme CCNUN1 TaxID=2038116 RepID=A0A2K8SMU0_9NOSO|nr:hypothetical protein [Nostoc flagelliforme]AUB36623.1 hypothetical protein COO91_02544 [Nostoc flagelliforme CCNUN1]
MDGNEVLGLVLVKMATSPVKADRDAIARIERECKADILKITTSLENSRIIAQSLNRHEQGKELKILATGLFWSGVIGIATMFVRPSYVWCGVSLGFVSGIAGRVMEPFKS